jgi:hypothetical protein
MINPLHYENICNPPPKDVEDVLETLLEAVERIPRHEDDGERRGRQQ